MTAPRGYPAEIVRVDARIHFAGHGYIATVTIRHSGAPNERLTVGPMESAERLRRAVRHRYPIATITVE